MSLPALSCLWSEVHGRRESCLTIMMHELTGTERAFMIYTYPRFRLQHRQGLRNIPPAG